MSNYRYSADLLDDILFRSGELTDGSSDFEAAALRYLNRAYQGLSMGGSELSPDVQEDWWWLRKSSPGVLTLLPIITTGTVAVTQNSTTATFSSAPGSVAGWFLKVSDHPDVFRISSIVGAAGVLDGVYTGADAPTATYQLMKLEYSLASDVLRVTAPMRTFRADRCYEIHGMDMSAMDRDWPIALVESGIPDRYAHTGETTVRFNRCGPTSSTELLRVEYDYLARPSDLTDSATEEPVVPRQWRKVLSDWATFWLLMDKNDDRADGVGLLARTTLKAMASEHRHRMGAIGRGAIGHLSPRQDDVTRSSGPLRTSSGLIIG